VAGLLRRLVRGDDAPGLGERGRVGRERAVGGLDLAGVDQGLAVEAELATLPAGQGEAVVVLEVEEYAVEDREARGARREQAQAERGDQRQAERRMGGVQLLDEIRGAVAEMSRVACAQVARAAIASESAT
jgi:hypothetical protein